jgi:hypothetical protein
MKRTSMKFALGYQHREDGEPFSAIVADFRDRVGEVYFPWVGQPSGRPPLGYGLEDDPAEVRQTLETESGFSAHGHRLDLLLNANCYGGRAVGVDLQNEIVSVIDHLDALDCAPDIVTTASPMIAHTVKTRSPALKSARRSTCASARRKRCVMFRTVRQFLPPARPAARSRLGAQRPRLVRPAQQETLPAGQQRMSPLLSGTDFSR